MKAKIISSGPYTKVFVDGNEISGVRKFSVEQEVGQELPIIKLELCAMEVEFDGECTEATEVSNGK